MALNRNGWSKSSLSNHFNLVSSWQPLKECFYRDSKEASSVRNQSLTIGTLNGWFSVSGLIANNGFKTTVNITATTMLGHWHGVTTYTVKLRNFGLFCLLVGYLSSVLSIRPFKREDSIVPHIQLDISCKLRQWQCLAVKTESVTSYISRQMWLHITWVSHSYFARVRLRRATICGTANHSVGSDGNTDCLSNTCKYVRIFAPSL